MKVSVSDNQGSSSQEWLVQGARLATQQGQVRREKKSHLLPAKGTPVPPPPAPGTIPNTSLPILHEDLEPNLDSDLGWSSSLAFTGCGVPSYIWVSVALGAWDSGDTKTSAPCLVSPSSPLFQGLDHRRQQQQLKQPSMVSTLESLASFQAPNSPILRWSEE